LLDAGATQAEDLAEKSSELMAADERGYTRIEDKKLI
jgi:hypothetical protein